MTRFVNPRAPEWMEQEAREALSKMHGQQMLSRIVDLMLLAYDRGVDASVMEYVRLRMEELESKKP